MVGNFLFAEKLSYIIFFAAKVAEHISAVAMTLLFNALTNKVFQFAPPLQPLVVQKAGPVFLDDTGRAVGEINKRVVEIPSPRCLAVVFSQLDRTAWVVVPATRSE